MSSGNNNNWDGGFNLGCIIPTYWPNTDTRSWTTLINTKKLYPDVDMIVVLPEAAALSVIHSRADADIWRSIVASLNDEDIIILGRMDTKFAKVSYHELQAIDHIWQSAFGAGTGVKSADYGLDGIFFDNMSNQITDVEFYRELHRYATNNSRFAMTAGNVRRPVSKEFAFDHNLPLVFIIKDSAGYDEVDSKYLQYYTQGVSKRSLGALVHSAPVYNYAWVAQVTQYVNWVYITSSDGSYNTGLPNYFQDLVFQLNTLQKTRG